jgi:VCBS repeat-containing protein
MSDFLPTTVETDVARALEEDIGSGDLTARLVPADQTAHARIISREPAVIAGRPWFDACFRALDPACRLDWQAVEAGGVANGTAGTNPSGNVLTNDTDVDTGDTKAVSAVSGTAAGTVGGATAGQYGSLTLNADGSYTYTVNNALPAVQALRTSAKDRKSVV